MKKKYQQEKRGQIGLDGSFFSFNEGEIDRRNHSGMSTNNNLETLLMRDSWYFDDEGPNTDHSVGHRAEITESLMNKIAEFRTIIEKDIQTRTEIFGEK